MGSYHGPKARVMRRFGEVLMPRPKYARILEKRAYPPGDHGKEKQFRSGRRSDYGMQLTEKQKVAFIYNVREGQLRRYFMKARQMPGNTGANLIALLERRLDNLVYRTGFATSRAQARQMVRHGHFNVNGRKVNIPSFVVKPGDALEVREKSRNNATILAARDATAHAPSPNWLEVDRDGLKARVLQAPKREDLVQIQLNEQLIVELYSK